MKNFIFIFLLLQIRFCLSQTGWVQKNDFPGGIRGGALSFSIGDKGYFCFGGNDTSLTIIDFWEYDPLNDTWSPKANCPGGWRSNGAVAFSIDTKGYIGLGTNINGTILNDWWEYDPANDTWLQKTNFPGTGRVQAVGFSIDKKGYVGTGRSQHSPAIRNKDFWEYDPVNDIWTQRADFGGIERENAICFSIGNKGYIGLGKNNSYLNDLWEYDPLTNFWTQKANFSDTLKIHRVSFSTSTKGYIGLGDYTLGLNAIISKDFWEYNPVADTWLQVSTFTGDTRFDATGFSIGSMGYVLTGRDYNQCFNDVWMFSPVVEINTLANEKGKISFFQNSYSTLLVCSSEPIAEIYVFDITGKQFIKVNPHKSTFELSIVNLPIGIINIVIIDNRKNKLNYKIIKWKLN